MHASCSFLPTAVVATTATMAVSFKDAFEPDKVAPPASYQGFLQRSHSVTGAAFHASLRNPQTVLDVLQGTLGDVSGRDVELALKQGIVRYFQLRRSDPFLNERKKEVDSLLREMSNTGLMGVHLVRLAVTVGLLPDQSPSDALSGLMDFYAKQYAIEHGGSPQGEQAMARTEMEVSTAYRARDTIREYLRGQIHCALKEAWVRSNSPRGASALILTRLFLDPSVPLDEMMDNTDEGVRKRQRLMAQLPASLRDDMVMEASRNVQHAQVTDHSYRADVRVLGHVPRKAHITF